MNPDYCEAWDWNSAYGCYGSGLDFLGMPDPGCPVGGSDDGGDDGGDSDAEPDCTSGYAGFMINFVTAHYADAVALSGKSGVAQDWLLAWSADESSYGTSSIAKKSGNCFGWHGKGDITCPSGTNKITGCFSSYYASGSTALFSTKNWFHYNGQYHVSAASILTQYTNAAKAFQALSNAGYNSNPNYGSQVAGDYFLGNVDGIENCLRSLGKLK